MHINSTQPLYCQEADQRKFFYPPPAAGIYPNGWLWYDGDPHGKTDFWTWDSLVTGRMARPSPVSIAMWGYFSPASGNGMIWARFRNDSSTVINGRALFVLTEDSLHYQAVNFDTIHNHVARDYLPDHNGTLITIAPGESVTVGHPFMVGTSWTADHCNLLAWLQSDSAQSDSTKEIWQGAMTTIAGLDIAEQLSIALNPGPARAVPNPCQTQTEIFLPAPPGPTGDLRIYDALGRNITELKPAVRENGSAVVWDCRDRSGARVGSGIYFYRTRSAQGSVTGKIIVR